MSIGILKEIISSHIAMRLRTLPEQLVDDIYAISLFMDMCDSIEPRLTFSFNTKSQVNRALTGKIQTYGQPSDEFEVKWNYAFWLKHPSSSFLIPGDSSDGYFGATNVINGELFIRMMMNLI